MTEETIVHGQAGKGGPGSRRILVIVLVAVIIMACIIGAAVGLILRNRQVQEVAEPGEAEEAAEEVPPDSLPPPPSNLRAEMIPIFDIRVMWNDNSDNEDGFHIYRRRVDILGSPEHAGSVGEDETEFNDEDVTCGATYQYTVASYNALGESPATECWEITLPPCPATRGMQIGIGAEHGRNFLTGQLGEMGDFYMDVDEGGRVMFMSDLSGQEGLVMLADPRPSPLYHVLFPPDPLELEDEVPAIPGNMYIAMGREGAVYIVFMLTEIGDPSTLEYILYFPNTELISLLPCERLGGRTPGGPCVSGDDVCDPTCTTPDPDTIGTTVPDDAPDDFDEILGEAAELRNRGGALFTPMTLLSAPTRMEYTEPTYTERDEDCGRQPCVSGDDICNPDCGTDEMFRERDDEEICDEGGPDYAATAPYPPCDDGEDTTLEALHMEGATTADRTSRYVDEDCGDPCVTGDGICDPTCMPNPDDTVRAGLAQIPCTDEDGDGQPDGCYPDDGETTPPGTPVPTMTASLRDGDCFGPCIPDGVCYPYCDPFYVPTMAVLGPTPMALYDPDCGPPCDPAADPCTCTPVTAASDMYGNLDWEELCPPSGCPEESPCYGLGPSYPCTDDAGARGICLDCECIPVMDCPDNPECNNTTTGASCTTDYDVPGTCQNCECVPLVTCPEGTPCYQVAPNGRCTTAAGNEGVCQDCECNYPNGCPADTDGCGQDSDCQTGTDPTGLPRNAEWRCENCDCRPPCFVNGVCEPGEHPGNCGEDCHACGDGIFTPAGGEVCDPSAGINCPPEQRCDNCTRCQPVECRCEGSTYVCDDDVGTRIDNDSRCQRCTTGPCQTLGDCGQVCGVTPISCTNGCCVCTP